MNHKQDCDTAQELTNQLAWIELWEQLSQCYQHLRNQLQAVAVNQQLSLDEMLVLCFLGRGKGQGKSQRCLSQLAHISPAKMSQLLERLRCAGLLVSARDSSDRRRQLWTLAPEGKKVFQCVWQLCGEMIRGSSELPKRIGVCDQLLRQNAEASSARGRAA